MTITYQKSIEIKQDKLERIAECVNEFLYESIEEYLGDYGEDGNEELIEIVANAVRKMYVERWMK